MFATKQNRIKKIKIGIAILHGDDDGWWRGVDGDDELWWGRSVWDEGAVEAGFQEDRWLYEMGCCVNVY